jgi:tRNA A-37 threonylcarbamoyl transferase component Bud32
MLEDILSKMHDKYNPSRTLDIDILSDVVKFFDEEWSNQRLTDVYSSNQLDKSNKSNKSDPDYKSHTLLHNLSLSDYQLPRIEKMIGQIGSIPDSILLDKKNYSFDNYKKKNLDVINNTLISYNINNLLEHENLYNQKSLDSIINYDHLKIYGYEKILRKKTDPSWTEMVSEYKDALQEHGVLEDISVHDENVPIPEEYVNVALSLAQHHPGLRYTGMVSLRDQSQHNVDILSFEYDEGSVVHELRIVAKDLNPLDARIPEFLRQQGIAANLVYDARRKIIMEHVGSHDLRIVVKQGSDIELITSCKKALEKIAEIQIVTSQNLHSLESDYGIVLPEINYAQEFKSRFVLPILGKSTNQVDSSTSRGVVGEQLVISPQTNSLMQAYNAFTQSFKAQFFTHGDFHAANCRISDKDCYIIDWEWAKVGRKFDDIARFVNGVTRERQDADVFDFRNDMYNAFINAHNEHSGQHKHPLMLPTAQLKKAYAYSLINDELYKVGEYILFGNSHPNVKEEKLEKSARCLERTIAFIDEALQESTQTPEQVMLTKLRNSLIAATATSSIAQLREVALMYMPKQVLSSYGQRSISSSIYQQDYLNAA